MNADGSGPRKVARVGNRAPRHGFWFSWSPDGRKIAFESNFDVYVVNADGTGRRNFLLRAVPRPTLRGLSGPPTVEESPSRAARTGDWEIFAIRPDGSGLRNLTRSPADDVGPAWSPAPK